ncbi:putative uncharacterized protein [Waddlia chondrophila 2032/99]|uniref:Uncharacterized protein n=2 Tax=Waddlia chondrophila TaxID=71667 RepID=D6YTF6_WADCW|nr:hypothetical protein [Waddlia chondrophila]ADI37417.1 hypothetical protein wcw_0040 [Waddlia chondrophila WSU 86-1044]CCB90831.1 putative uncharacterized protein [Waddlia chondrophila 2032/99]
MTVNFTFSGKNDQLSHEELESRLIALRNAKKSTHIIKTDLTVKKFNIVSRIVWICLSFFPSLRNSLFDTNLTLTRKYLEQLDPQASSGRMSSLLSEVFEIVNPSPDKPKSKKKRLIKTSQGIFNGLNWRVRSERYVKKLNEECPPAIQFNTGKLSWATIGGNCSAIALDVINHFLRSSDKQPVEKRLKKIIKKFRSGGDLIEMRARQGAFNCIEFKNISSSDPIIQKIQALAKFHSLSAVESTPAFDLLKDLKQSFSEIANSLNSGVYLLRIIKPSENEKKEVHGHSMVLIRCNEGDYFFDPNKGLEKIESLLDERLFEHLKHNYKRFEISQATFIKITL